MPQRPGPYATAAGGLILLLAASSAAAERPWALPDGRAWRDAAVLTAPSEACRAEITAKVQDLQRKLPAAEIGTDWFSSSPYARVQSGEARHGFYLSYDEFDRQCRVTDQKDGLSRLLPACQCAWVDPVRAAVTGDQASYLKTNATLKALQQECSKTATPADTAVAEYRRTLRHYFHFKVKAPELVKTSNYGLRRDAWSFGKALAALERDEFDPKSFDDEVAKLHAAEPGLATMCAAARNLFADRIAGIAWEVKAFEAEYKVTVPAP